LALTATAVKAAADNELQSRQRQQLIQQLNELSVELADGHTVLG